MERITHLHILLRSFILLNTINDYKDTFNFTIYKAKTKERQSFVGGVCQFTLSEKTSPIYGTVPLFIVAGYGFL
jgi:hypothetical protein